jgi:hypothetical protein
VDINTTKLIRLQAERGERAAITNALRLRHSRL